MKLLELKSVVKKYGDFTAVDGIDLSLYEGEAIGLLGPNGAGKSTTISMIATLYKPTSGEIFFLGDNTVDNPKVIQKSLGYVPQEIALYDQLNGYDNLKYFGALYGLDRKQIKTRIAEVSEIIGISKRLKDKVKTYSGGMKRRLNIGVALMHSPKLIIMDEPTVGIDPQSRNHILETVRNLNAVGTSVIYTSHYMEEVSQLCKRIYIMDQGRVIAEGTHEALIEQAKLNEMVRIKFEAGQLPPIESFNKFNGLVECLAESEDTYRLSFEKIETNVLGKIVGELNGIISFETITPDLEQVFLKITGRGLRD